MRIPLSVAFLLVDGAGIRLGILAVSAVSDIVDGWWARRIGGSRIGAALDPVCDKLFVGAAFFVVARSQALSLVEIAGVLLRDLTAAVAFLVTLVRRRPTTLQARTGGKAVTIGQVLTVAAFLTESSLLRPLAWVTAAISIYAIYDYTRAAMRR